MAKRELTRRGTPFLVGSEGDPLNPGASIECIPADRIPFCDQPNCKKVGAPGVRIVFASEPNKLGFKHLEICYDCAAWLCFRLRQLDLPLKLCP